MMPVTPMTTFLPTDESRRVASFRIRSPGGRCKSVHRGKAYTRSRLATSSARELGGDGLAGELGGEAGARERSWTGAQQQPQEHALERGLAVDAVVVGAAEEGLGDLGEAAPRVGVVGPGKVGGQHARPRDPAVARLVHRLALALVLGLEARADSPARRYDRPRQCGQAVAAQDQHAGGAGRV